MWYRSLSIPVPAPCNHRCLGCTLKVSEKPAWQRVYQWLQADQFHRYYPRIRSVDLYGGDPLLYQELGDVLRCFKKRRIAVRLWSNFDHQIDPFFIVKPWVHTWLFYVPIVDPANYGFHVGTQPFQKVVAMVKQVSDMALPFMIHARITPESLAELPAYLEQATQWQVPVLLHYLVQEFSPAERQAIAYFQKSNAVVIIPVKTAYPTHACWVPLQDNVSFIHLYQFARVRAWVWSIRKKYGFYGR